MITACTEESSPFEANNDDDEVIVAGCDDADDAEEIDAPKFANENLLKKYYKSQKKFNKNYSCEKFFPKKKREHL